MPFVPATIEINPAHIGTGIKASLRGGKNTKAKLTLFISMRVAAQFRWLEGDGIEVLLGDGPEHGLIRLRKNNSTAQTKFKKKGTGKGEFLILQLGHQAAFVDRNEQGRWCNWEEVEDGWVEVVLPKWVDETAPGRTTHKAPAYTPPATKPPVSAPVAQPYKSPTVEAARAERRGPGRPPAKKNVTADLMGDPPPGRREMLEQFGKLKA